MSKRRSTAGEPPAAGLEHSAPGADGGSDEAYERPSRSARKRQAEALQKLGVALSRMRPAQLLRLQLPEKLLEAILEAQRLRSRVALGRQRQYIGRLMRDIDAEPIERALAAFCSSGDAKMPG
ncbi:MAG: ribosome biogenesis factor YjgA [Steroidobacterales bacterium]